MRLAFAPFRPPERRPATTGAANCRAPSSHTKSATARSGGRLLFAPVFAEINDELQEAIAAADVAFLDGTFFYDDEMIAAGLMDKRARHLGHLPLGGPDGTLAILGHISTRIVFTHVNNSNPVLDPNSEEFAMLRTSGAAVAYDGMEITL